MLCLGLVCLNVSGLTSSSPFPSSLPWALGLCFTESFRLLFPLQSRRDPDREQARREREREEEGDRKKRKEGRRRGVLQRGRCLWNALLTMQPLSNESSSGAQEGHPRSTDTPPLGLCSLPVWECCWWTGGTALEMAKLGA
ncbi:hypothetical protein MHYP_G00262740 [Metynnis hypsauchen]